MKRFPILQRLRKAVLCTSVLGSVVVFSMPSPLHSQAPSDSVNALTPSVEGGASLEQRSATVAGVLEYLFPTLGFAYAEDWKRGLPSAGVRLVGFGLFMSSFFQSDQDLLVPGLCLYSVGTIWGIVGAVDAAKDHNEGLLGRARVGVLLSDGGLRTSIGLRF